MFTSIIDSAAGGLSLKAALLCTGVSLLLGLVIAIIYRFTGDYSKNFILSLVILPALVQVIIMMVNGNLGAGVAVLGTFSLVRFRSVPGNSRDICSIVFAMAIGLATGMGYLTFAGLMVVIIGAAFLVLSKIPLLERDSREKELRVVIPESLDYTNVFDDLFDEFTSVCRLERVRTTNLGSMFELRYRLRMKKAEREKEFIDALRCRNGNLTIVCGQAQTLKDEL